MGASDIDRPEGLALGRWGLRFEDPASERSYVAWQRDRTMRFNRSAIISSLGALLVGMLPLTLFAKRGLAPWIAGGGVLVLALASAALLAATYRRAWDERVHALIAGTNALFGLAVVSVNAIYLGNVEVSAAGAILVAFFSFAVNRTRPAYAAAAAAMYLAVDLVLLQRAYFVGRIGLDTLLLAGLMLVVTFGSGWMTALVIDADGRHSYRQVRIIEAQKETIARERARSEELLKRELSHQVAERSKELGEAFARSGASLDAAVLTSGERFAQRYQVVGALGQGGMGAVYEVERLTDGARLALKAVTGEVSASMAARFAREAEIGARVRHRNLIAIVDVGVSSGVPYLVMDLVRGGSLEDERSRFGDVDWSLPLLAQIALGLAALHQAGVVHRDLKPANVLLDDGTARISDFGISRFGALVDAGAVDADADADTMEATPARSSNLTGTGVVMGTPLYMAPEAGVSSRALEPSADVFAFGIMAYEMLTGRKPFARPPAMLAMAAQPIPAPEPIDAEGVDATLRALLLDCLAVDPARRPRTGALQAALAGFTA